MISSQASLSSRNYVLRVRSREGLDSVRFGQAARYLMRENLKVAWSEFTILS